MDAQFPLFPHSPSCPPDSRCTACYSADEIADAESFDGAYDGITEDAERERHEFDERIDPQTGFLQE